MYTEYVKKKSRKIRAPCGDDVSFFMLVFARVHYESFSDVLLKFKYIPAVRSNILSKLMFSLQAVCDTPIARITGCVSSYRSATPLATTVV